MGAYSISEVEMLTGIQSHTLRVWERRYELIKARRTNTNIRYYDDSQLKLLLNIGILLNQGYRISKIDKLSKEQINESVFEILEKKSDANRIQQGLVISMLELDEGLFNLIYNRSVKDAGVLKTILDLIYPFLHHVGLMWGTDRAMPAQEHFVSNLIRAKLFSAIESLETPLPDSKRILLFLPEGELHEIGLLLGNFLLRTAGARTYYLGNNVPTADVIEIIDLIHPDALFSFSMIWRMEFQQQFQEINYRSNTSLFVAGQVPEELKSNSKWFTFLESPDEILKIPGT